MAARVDPSGVRVEASLRTKSPPTYGLVLSGRDASLSPGDAPLVAATDDVVVLVEIEDGGAGVCFSGQVSNCRSASASRDVCR